MSLIEGVGDEVTIIFGILLLVLLLTIAWISTHTRDIPFFSIVIVEVFQRPDRRRAQQNAADTQGAENESATGQETASELPLQQETGSVEESTAEASPYVTVPPAETVTAISESSIQNSELDEVKRDGGVTNGAEDHTKEIQTETVSTAEHTLNKQSLRDSDSQGESINTQTLPDTDLRQRRIAFFEQKQPPSDKNEIAVSNIADHPVSSDSETITNTTSESSVPTEDVSKQSLPSATERKSSEESSHIKSKSRSNEQTDSSNASEMDTLNGSIRVRLKYLNDSQRLVHANPDDTIAQFRRQNFAEELQQNKLIRFIFNGQEMRDDNYSLQSYNIGDNSVIHCLITQSVHQNQTQSEEIEVDLDIGNFMFPLFAIILGLIWFTRISYRQYFNATSTVSLVAITFLFLVAYASTFRRNRNHVHVD